MCRGEKGVKEKRVTRVNLGDLVVVSRICPFIFVSQRQKRTKILVILEKRTRTKKENEKKTKTHYGSF